MSAFGISKSSCGQVGKADSLDNDDATQPRGNFAAFVSDGGDTSERFRTTRNPHVGVLTIFTVLVGNQVEAMRLR